MNLTLFYTSISMTIIHIIKCFYTVNILFNAMMIIGCASSIANHGTTNDYIRMLDRIIMTIFCILELIYMETHTYMLIMAAMLYLYGKYRNNINSHICAHMLITMFHVMQ